MLFNRHSHLEGKHSFLSPSKYHWVNYDDEQLLEKFDNHMTAVMGTRLHAFAKDAIELGQQMPDNSKTLNMYVNDCLGYRLQPEVPLFYSVNCFGTADAMDFDEDNRVLRIFDLKMGVSPTSQTQLEVYAAIFCLEYKVNPFKIAYDLRIYQNDEVREFNTDPEVIAEIMEIIKHSDAVLEERKGA